MYVRVTSSVFHTFSPPDLESARTTTPGNRPTLKLLQAVASERDPWKYWDSKEADMGRWKKMADLLQNLGLCVGVDQSTPCLWLCTVDKS